MRTLEHGHKGCYVADIIANENIDGVFAVTQAQQYQAKNGPFWRLTLQDATGHIEGKVWSPLAHEFSEFATGALYAVGAKSSVYKDKVELSISSIVPLPEEAIAGLPLGDFVAVSPFPVEQMLAELQELLKLHVVHPPLVRFFDLLLNDEVFLARFTQAPAAKVMHHAYAGGLLEHTLSICRLCMSIANNYPHVDRQILLTGALCHDLGKIWELTSGLSIDYTDEGRLVGHISLGLERITPYMHKAGLESEHIMHIQHLILSHHGAYEFGAPRLPSTAEAFILHFADNIDAKLQQVAQALEGDNEGPHWSTFVRGLDRQVYNAAPIASLGQGVGVGVLSPDYYRADSVNAGYTSSESVCAEGACVPDSFQDARILSSPNARYGEGSDAECSPECGPECDMGPTTESCARENIKDNVDDAAEYDDGYLDALVNDFIPVSSDFTPPAESNLSTNDSPDEGGSVAYAVDGPHVSEGGDMHDTPDDLDTRDEFGGLDNLGNPDNPDNPDNSDKLDILDNLDSSDKFDNPILSEVAAPLTPDTWNEVKGIGADTLPGEAFSTNDGPATFQKSLAKKAQLKVAETVTDDNDNQRVPGEEDATVTVAKKDKSSSVRKQSSLPLLEQCSLLSKE